MADREGTLRDEVRAFAAHLIGVSPSARTADAYVAAHEKRAADLAPADRFDLFLVRFARKSAIGAELAGAYARRFRHAGLLQKKLVLTLALLECSPEASAILDRPEPGGAAGFWLRAVMRGAFTAFITLMAVLAFWPWHCALAGRAVLRDTA